MRGACVALVLLSAFAAPAAGATIQFQSRSVAALVEVPGAPQRGEIQQFSAPDFAPFSATASADYALGGSVSATQNSTLSPDRIQVSGGVTIANEWFAPDFVHYRADSLLQVAFEVVAPEPFSLEGEFGGGWDVAGFNIDQGGFEASLTGPAGLVFATSIPTPATNPSGHYEPPLPFASAGLLSPGVYTLTVSLTDELFAAAGEIGGGGSSWFYVDLRIPEPSTLLLVACGVVVAAARSRPAVLAAARSP